MCCARLAHRSKPSWYERMTLKFAPGLLIRGIAPPLRLADFKLVAFDMDSTLINIECVDEIAEAGGRATLHRHAHVAALADRRDQVGCSCRRRGERDSIEDRARTDGRAAVPGLRG